MTHHGEGLYPFQEPKLLKIALKRINLKSEKPPSSGDEAENFLTSDLSKVAQAIAWATLINLKAENFPSSWGDEGKGFSDFRFIQSCSGKLPEQLWINLKARKPPPQDEGNFLPQKPELLEIACFRHKFQVKKFSLIGGGFCGTKAKVAWNCHEREKFLTVKDFSVIMGGAILPQKATLVEIAWNG